MNTLDGFPAPCPVGSTLTEGDWQKILLALETYVIHEETRLKGINARERDWTDLEDYNKLIRDIQLYCIGRDYVRQ